MVLVLDAESLAERRAREVRDVAGGEDVVASAGAAELVDDDPVVDRASPVDAASSVAGSIPSPATIAVGLELAARRRA